MITASSINKYILKKRIPVGKTVEETINSVLEQLINDPENIKEGPTRIELISSASIILNSLNKIKDPVKLYGNLAKTFEKRGHCIFTNTVGNALLRLQREAVKQERGKEIENIWRSLENGYTKKYISSTLDIKFLRSILQNTPNIMGLKPYVAFAIATNKDCGKNEFLDLIESSTKEILYVIAKTILRRKDLTKNDLLHLAGNKDINIRNSAIVALIQNKKFTTADDIYDLLIKFGAKDEVLRTMISIAVETRRKDIKSSFEGNFEDILKRRKYGSEKYELKFNSGKRKYRTAKIAEQTKSLRK